MGLADRDYIRNRNWKYGSGKPGKDFTLDPASQKNLFNPPQPAKNPVARGQERDSRADGLVLVPKRRWPGILRFAVAVIAFGVAGGIAFSIVREMI